MHNGLFGMLDVLGFAKFNETQGLDEVVAYYERLIKNVTNLTALSAMFAPESFVISDTICVTPTNQLHLCDNGTFFLYLSMLLNHSCKNLYNGRMLPLRGAVSFDEYLFDAQRKIFLGKAISSAYKWEQKQKWIGVSICPSLIATPNMPIFLNLIEKKLLVNWEVPTSDGIVKTLAVNFVTRETAELILSNLQAEFDFCDTDIKPKYYATICFVKHICDKNLFVMHHEIADWQRWIEATNGGGKEL